MGQIIILVRTAAGFSGEDGMRRRWGVVERKFYSLSESSEAIEERLERPKLGGPLTSDVVPNSLYHPITMLDRFRSSSMI